MSTKQTVLSLIGTLIIGLAIGRFSLPAKVVIKTQTVEVEKKQSDTDKNDHSITTTVQTKKPDGSITTTTTIAKNVQTDTKSTLTDNKDTQTSKETTYNTRNLTIGFIASTHPLSALHPTLTYGGEVNYRILGPITVGGMFLTDGTVGAVLGLTF